MLRIPVQSRKGNFALIVLGTVYSLGALAVLVLLIADVQNAAGILDRLMEMVLVISALCGIWFVAGALQNLGVHVHRSSGAH
jgi:hypothetical protein